MYLGSHSKMQSSMDIEAKQQENRSLDIYHSKSEKEELKMEMNEAIYSLHRNESI
jgi:hypothetical protein